MKWNHMMDNCDPYEYARAYMSTFAKAIYKEELFTSILL